MKLRTTKDGVVLCCNKVKCPEVKQVNPKQISISDDYGNTVTIDTDQAELIPEALRLLRSREEEIYSQTT
jgi:hypothetical protein